MSQGSLAVVEEWLAAVNHGDTRRVVQLSAGDIEISGPRGVTRGREVLAGWLARAGFSAEPVRWFCGADGAVVAGQEARWADPVTGAVRGSARVASQFRVEAGQVTRYARHADLAAALAAAGLGEDDEVTRRGLP